MFSRLTAHLHEHVRHSDHCTFTCTHQVHVNVQWPKCLTCAYKCAVSQTLGSPHIYMHTSDTHSPQSMIQSLYASFINAHTATACYCKREQLYLTKHSLSDTHFSTGRLLFEFNRLQHTLAAPEVFVAHANPVSLLSGYGVSVVSMSLSKPR